MVRTIMEQLETDPVPLGTSHIPSQIPPRRCGGLCFERPCAPRRDTPRERAHARYEHHSPAMPTAHAFYAWCLFSGLTFQLNTPPCAGWFSVITFVPRYVHASNGVCIFRPTTRSRPRLGLVVRCGDLALSQKKACLFVRFFHVQSKHQNDAIFVNIEGFRPCLSKPSYGASQWALMVHPIQKERPKSPKKALF